MTDEILKLRALVEKTPDADFLGKVIGCADERLMELEVGAATGAGFGEKSRSRLAQWIGDRDREWEIWGGTIGPRHPKLRTGPYLFSVSPALP